MPARTNLIFVLFVALTTAIAGTTRAEEFSTRYDMWLYGLPVGQAVFASRFENGQFAISGRFRSAGLARIFERVDGEVTARGRIGNGGAQPEAFVLDYVSGEERQKTLIRYTGEGARLAKNDPPSKRGRNWVHIAPEDLIGAADPISALLIAAASPEEVCERTVKVYDGELRLDLVMRPAAPGEAFDSGVVTCHVTFKPVSGFRPGHSTIRYLRDKATMSVAFAPIRGTDLYSPVEATLGTKIGTVWIKARQLAGR